MVTGMLGKKVGMTRVFTADGRWLPVTVLEAGPCLVVQRKAAKPDGYEAVQIGFGARKESRVTKPLQGHFTKAGVSPRATLREFPVEEGDALKPGDEVRVDIFTVGERVDVSGTSTGRGFAGVHRRHKFSGGPETHGSNHHRRPGSIGQSADPSKTFKGLRLPGQMGNVRVTVQSLEVVQVHPEKNLLVVLGAVPGANGGLVEVKKSVKGSK